MDLKDEEDFTITHLAFLEVFEGIASVINCKTDRGSEVWGKKEIEKNKRLVREWVLTPKKTGNPSCTGIVCFDVAENGLLFEEWRTSIAKEFATNWDSRNLSNLALAVAFMRESSLRGQIVTAARLTRVWRLILDSLAGHTSRWPFYRANHSVEGSFLIVPLCSLMKDGNIDQLFELHVWPPGRPKAISDFAIHSHQEFAQCWILAGEVKNHLYDLETVEDPAMATNAEYSLPRSDGKTYGADAEAAPLVNTGILVRATSEASAIHTRNMAYSISAGAFHGSEVQSDILHATLFLFDSRHGPGKDVRLGAIGGESASHSHAPTRSTCRELARMVDLVRSWELFMSQGKQHSDVNELEQALQAFNSALSICTSTNGFPKTTHYKCSVLAELGRINRKLGRHEQARQILETAMAGMKPSMERIRVSGELGVVYRHMNRLADAKRVLELQYDTTNGSKMQSEIYRALGNLGMVNYLLFLERPDESDLLEVATKQLTQSVENARRIRETAVAQAADQKSKSDLLARYTIRECVCLQRLALCYTASGDGERAIAVALEAVTASKNPQVTTPIAMSKFHYSHALKMNGRHEEAAKVFQSCLAAVTFLCREPSEENHIYLRELIGADIDLDIADENGYTALDYAVFNSDSVAEELILKGMGQKMTNQEREKKLVQKLRDARRRKGYRELFQEKLRPVLICFGKHLVDVRAACAEALAADNWKGEIFDGFKVVQYVEFLRLGRLPRSTDGLARPWQPSSKSSLRNGLTNKVKFQRNWVIFISYRWTNNSPAASPDDAQHMQYRRMLAALEDFTEIYQIAQERLSIWLDVACIDQGNPDAGICALPLNLAQCDAMISLVDEKYYSRAWCCVETLMMQTLIQSYGGRFHTWYEQVFVPPPSEEVSGNGKWELRRGSMNQKIELGEKELTFEEDRDKVKFLERQSISDPERPMHPR